LFRLPLLFAVTILTTVNKAKAQPGAEVELNKPEKYETRKLASEKTGEKKFTIPRRFKQNVTTHYNYYFNATNRLNDVVNRAKASFKDDYTLLLPFYNYTIEATAQDKGELDSVIYKSTAGILLHDLRSDWVDNMYLIMAKAYFYRNNLDSALGTLQYINFAFAPKEEGNYDKPIGSNASNETGEFSIATKEKNSLIKKIMARPPSRNESFIWQIRSFIESDELPEAAGLIEILKNDPNFPKRLTSQLNEVTAYWFYKQNIYDSAAAYLVNALDQATNNQEKARWEYLAGQMYQRANNVNLAEEYYAQSIKHTIDPVLDVYARLNTLKLNRGVSKTGRDYARENIDALIKMAKKDKYLNYRDIIYFAAATIELDRKKFDEAEALLLKSVQTNNNNNLQRAQSFLLLADMNYDRKKYTPAHNYYDSTDINSLKTQIEKDRVLLRKPPLKIVAANQLVITTEDSLQALAKLPENKRNDIIKAKLKELRKAKGLNEETPALVNPAIQQQAAPDLFGSNAKNTDFYFYNSSLKATGFNEFKAKWGQRTNVDNWRRISAVNNQRTLSPDMNISDIDMPLAKKIPAGTDLSMEGLKANIPLTEQLVAASDSSIEDALNNLGETFLSKMEDYQSAIYAYEELLRRFPNSDFRDKARFNLVYAYRQNGDRNKSEAYKKMLANPADTSRYAQLMQNPLLAKKDDNEKIAAAKTYEQIYKQFIEGDFENAKQQKKIADSTYGNSYWTPQLLYIEAIYYVSSHDDTTAIKVLNDLVSNFTTNPMAEKAKTMIDVLGRRTEIENYLAKLEVTRKADTQNPDAIASSQPPTIRPVKVAPVIIKKDNPGAQTPTAAINKTARLGIDSSLLTKAPVVTTPPADTARVVVLKPVAKPTIATVSSSKNSAVSKPNPINGAIAKAPTQMEVKKEAVRPPIAQPTLITPAPLPVDTKPATAENLVVKGFTFKPADPHYVIIVLDKVDKVYASEARNAFNRYNREKYYSKPIEINSLQLDDRFNLVLQGPFSDVNAAVDYVNIVRPQAPSRILPWLSADKYSFLVISNENLEVLKTNSDFTAYKALLEKAFPGKF